MKFASGFVTAMAAIALNNACYSTAVLAAAFALFLALAPEGVNAK